MSWPACARARIFPIRSGPMSCANVTSAASVPSRRWPILTRPRGADMAVIVGNDQLEVFTRESIPAFSVFRGPYVEGIPRTPEFLAKLNPAIARAELDRTPQVYTQYPCLPDVGWHVTAVAYRGRIRRHADDAAADRRNRLQRRAACLRVRLPADHARSSDAARAGIREHLLSAQSAAGRAMLRIRTRAGAGRGLVAGRQDGGDGGFGRHVAFCRG